jgi:membrane-bound lytic murein transglycosylase B
MLVRVALALAVALAAAPAWAQRAQTYAGRADVQSFVAEMVERHGFVRGELEALFAKTRPQPSILKAMTPSVKGVRSWPRYRARFVNDTRIQAGVAFWERHAPTLDRAAAQFGVPPEIIVAIIGVETVYGQQMGDYRVVDALSTLAFDYPRRADYFRSELEEFLLLAREGDLELLGLRGSYAGAVGIPQFMPGSIRRYAVDFDGDGRRDLRSSPADAIGSVANFLRSHGWRAGEAVAFPAVMESPTARALADGGVDPVRTAAELRQAQVRMPDALPDDTPCVLVELDAVDAESVYWVGLTNFYVITRYNRSSFYAASVLELAEAIKAASPGRRANGGTL